MVGRTSPMKLQTVRLQSRIDDIFVYLSTVGTLSGADNNDYVFYVIGSWQDRQ